MEQMQRVFISYSHKDGEKHLDKLATKLAEAGFTYCFVDKRDIEPGDEWREAIDGALAESFIVLVILTPCAAKSHFVTYEWARALGDGLKVVPLLFESPVDEDHPLVNRMQREDCTGDIPDRVIETVKRYGETPPDTRYLNQLIMNTVLPFRILARVSLWLYPYTRSNTVPLETFASLVEKARSEAKEVCSHTLLELMVDKSCAFNSKQVRKCRELLKRVECFRNLLHCLPTQEVIGGGLSSELVFMDQSKRVSVLDRYRTRKLEPIFEFFDAYREYYWLDNYLNSISNSSQPAWYVEQAFKATLEHLRDDAHPVWIAIEIVRKSRDM